MPVGADRKVLKKTKHARFCGLNSKKTELVNLKNAITLPYRAMRRSSMYGSCISNLWRHKSPLVLSIHRLHSHMSII